MCLIGITAAAMLCNDHQTSNAAEVSGGIHMLATLPVISMAMTGPASAAVSAISPHLCVGILTSAVAYS